MKFLFKKAQGLPMTTIVLIVISLTVLVSVGLFFFGQFGQTTSGATEAQCVQKCQTIGAYYAQPNVLGPTKDDNIIKDYCGACPGKTCNFDWMNSNGNTIPQSLICEDSNPTNLNN